MTSLLKLALGITLLVLLTTTGFAAERLRLATTALEWRIEEGVIHITDETR